MVLRVIHNTSCDATHHLMHKRALKSFWCPRKASKSLKFLAPVQLLVYFEEIIHMLHCCSLVDLLKMGNMDLLKSFAEAPIFLSPINPHKRSHMSACGQANDRGKSYDHRQSSYNHRHELTGRSLGQCLRRENMNITACKDLRSQLQQKTSAIKKKCLFLFYQPSLLLLSPHLYN